MHVLQDSDTVAGTMLEEIEKIKQRAGHPRFYPLVLMMMEIHRRKNMSYAKDKEPLSNFHRAAQFGVKPSVGATVRMGDKWARIEEFMSGKKPDITGEGLPDALLDNAVYSIIVLCLLEEEQGFEFYLTEDCRLGRHSKPKQDD